MKNILFIVLTFMSIGSFAQSKEEKEALKAAMNSKKLTYQGNESLKGDKPTQAEVDYRNAIAEDNTNLTAQYNLGTLLYKQKNYGEAFAQLMKAANAKQMSEAERHQIFHNLGNAFMKEKTYDKAVLAYREALQLFLEKNVYLQTEILKFRRDISSEK
ncbi:MAG: tetratricopeptide repeat protein, partial [Capnocytophaga leadbetteri]